METRVGVGVVVRRADGLVLVGRRVAEPGRPLAVPGRKLDPGESVEECAVRELDKFAELVWIDPSSPPLDLFPATAALLERLV